MRYLNSFSLVFRSEDDTMVNGDIDNNSNSEDDEYSRASMAQKRENNERLMQLGVYLVFISTNSHFFTSRIFYKVDRCREGK